MRAGMVAVEELLLYFLIVPAIAYAGAAFWVRRAARKNAEQELGFLRRPGVLSRFLVFSVLFFVPVVFGAVVLPQVLRIPEGTNEDLVVRALGAAWATASLLTVFSQAWIVVRRRDQAFQGPGFARVLILCVIPVAIMDFMLLADLIISGRADSPRGGPPLSDPAAAALILGIEFVSIGSISGPLAAFLSNRVQSLEPGRFSRALLLGITGAVPAVVCLVLALRAIGTA